MERLHSLLKRQLKRYFKRPLSHEGTVFVEAVNRAYWQSDADRAMLERSLDLSSQELLQANSEMRAVFRVFPDLFFKLNLDGRILDIKGASPADYHLPARELIGRLLPEVPLGNLRETFARALSNIRQHHAIVNEEYSLRVDDQEYFYEARFVPLLEDQVIAIVRDITERTRVEHALYEARQDLEKRVRERTAELSEAQRIAHVGSWEWDLETRRVTWSDEMYRIAGVQESGSDFTVEKSFEVIHPDDRAVIFAKFERLLKHPREFSVEHRIRRPDDTERIVNLRGKPLFTGDGRVSRMVGTVQDITEAKLLEAQIEKATRVSSLGRLAATVAHEFNNALMGIQPFVEIIKKRAAGDAQIQKASSLIFKSVERGKRITQEILAFTQPSEPTMRPVSVQSFMNDLAREARALAADSVILAVHVPQEEPLFVQGDQGQLNQILMNLLLNARDAMPKGGKISVSVSKPVSGTSYPFGVIPDSERFLHFRVQDTGRGVKPEHMQHLFEPLFTTKKIGGTGLGLAVSHQVVTRHGGHIFAESTVGAGTTFHLFLPVSAPRIVDAPGTSLSTALEGTTVLLIEDDPGIAFGLKSVLELENLNVEVIHTGEEAESTIERLSPDVVVIDIGLPGIDGIEVYRRVSRRWPKLPVIFSTGHGNEAKVLDYLASSHVEFLLKPYASEVLLEALGRVLAGTEAQRSNGR